MRSICKRRRSVAAWLSAVSVMVFLSCGPDARRCGWDEKWGTAPAHRTFPGDCGICHAGGEGGVPRSDLTFDHAQETGQRLEGAHVHAACLRCHNDRGPVTAYAARGCAGCHRDPHVSVLGPDCQNCHSQVSWKPAPSAARESRLRFHVVPAHAGPSCASCHIEAGVGRAQVGPAQCEPCHQ